MPELDGLSAIRQIRADPEIGATPIIALTALAIPGDCEHCLAAGATVYLAKPIGIRLSGGGWHALCMIKGGCVESDRPVYQSLDVSTITEGSMINFILWLLFGALVGWLASLVMRTDAQQGTLLNIVVGIIGAFLGGLLFNLFGVGGSTINNNDFSLSSLIVSFIGAVVLLGIINLFRRSTVR